MLSILLISAFFFILWASAITSATQGPFLVQNAAAPLRPASPGLEELTTITLPFEAHLGDVTQYAATHSESMVRLVHPNFPETSIRIKRHPPAWKDGQPHDEDKADPKAFCDPSVASWTGYIDTIDGRSLFFFFFESRRDPAHDPVVLWTNGGPGASGALGLFMEHGPCRPHGRDWSGPPINGTEPFVPSWNNQANMLYIEQPAGVGYSYLRFGDPSWDSVKAGRDVYQFLRIFFATFKHLAGNALHLAGESYAGRYLPEFAREIVDNNEKLLREAVKAGREVQAGSILNLKSILIGNGLMKDSIMITASYDMMCTTKADEGLPAWPVGECAAMRPWVGRCAKDLKQHCEDDFSESRCAAATAACTTRLWNIMSGPGRNPYDLHDDCKYGVERFCYRESEWVEQYLGRDDVRAFLGAAPRSQTGEYKLQPEDVTRGFTTTGDVLRDIESFELNALLLERGIKVLIYVGKADICCPYLLSLRALEEIAYAPAAGIRKSLRDWEYQGRVVGDTATGGNLTFASIRGAGHLVPYRLEHAWPMLQLFNRWLAGEEI